MRRIFFLLVVVLWVLPASSQGKRPFTFEDMMALRRVGEPVPSPDGKWVLFSAVDVDLAANTKTPHVWIVPLGNQAQGPASAAKGSPANPSSSPGRTGNGASGERVLIGEQDADRPRWAPDGKRFAFLSTKENGSQVWIADFDSAAGAVTGVHRLTDIKTEASGELWSPDGKNILFTSDVYPECDGTPAEEAVCNAKKAEQREQSKVKALVFDRLLYRHWNAYKEGKRSHIFAVPVPTLPQSAREGRGTPIQEARDLTPGDYDAPVFSLGGQDDYAFSPDGQELCYTSNHDKVEATSTNNDLWTVPVNWDANAKPADVLAKTKNLTTENPASDSTPLYSPDGRWIAYRAQQRPGYESDRFRLMLYDRETGEKKNLTEDLDRWVGSFTWLPNSSRLYFTIDDQGKTKIYSLLVATGKRVELPILILATIDDLIVDSQGIDIYFTNNSVQGPNEIWRSLLCPNGCDPPAPPYPVTHLNDSVLSQVAMSPMESFWFEGAHGDKVQGFMVKPPNFDPNKKYPLKFILHGGPEVPAGDEWSYRWNSNLFAASGYVVIEINFHGSPGYGQKFVDSINGDWGGAPFEDLMKGLDYAEKTYPFIDRDRECALGASYGGYMANWILGHTDRFKCIVSHDGMFNSTSAWGTTEELWFNEWEFKGTPYTNRALYDTWSPHLSASKFKTPTLVVHGQLDYRLDVSEGFQLFTTLQRLGVPSKMLYFPDEGHWVLKPQNSQLWWKTVSAWVDQWAGQQ
jgi:dipeptidyl aminopeptidase/acylaminoacyl peptidase